MHEGTTQGDPTANGDYGIALTPLLKHLLIFYPERDPKMVAFADDFTSAGRLSKMRSWWKELLNVGPKYGYFPKPNKTILILKSKYESKAAEIFENTNIKISSPERRHLGAVIGSEQYRKNYNEEIVNGEMSHYYYQRSLK